MESARDAISATEPRASRRWRGVGGASDSRVVLAIALAAGIASFAMNFWIPFLPLYMRTLGATSDANALFWVGVATSVQGVARLVTGPAWGILSDRYGRRLMFVRALGFASVTTAIAAFATEPWHIAVAFACQGIFSGFIPAAVALTSVSVPDSKLNASLSLVTGAQYLGNTVGPAVGSVLAIVLGMRGAIVAGAVMPALAGLMVLAIVPRDETRPRPRSSSATAAEGTPTADMPTAVEPSFWRSLSFQFFLALFFYFFLFGGTQVVRLATPVSLADLQGSEDVEGIVGIAFTLAGIASMVGVLIIGRRYVVPGRFRMMLGLGCVVTAVAHVLLAASPVVTAYVVAFAAISLVQAAMLPATNTLIAANVSRARRGTAFGLAGS
ncbi:MAG: MFS transporter, partial [Dehalococcoidia bacterium]|nr:MFS transporter [Dehalococcoidia bacterium]